jgi:signal transduction histidine kinase/uncharacterized membrane protein YagU involved in acid resistance
METIASLPDRRRYLGIVIAVLGFVLTRFTVVTTVQRETALTTFLVGPAPFLAVGLAVSVFGVALSVSTYSGRDIATVTVWCLLGTVAAAVVVGSALLESRLGAGPMLSSTGERLLPRVLIAGAAGGVVLGLRSAATSRQSRRLADQADRLTLLNRILRHEVLNRVNVIEGYAALDADRLDRSRLGPIARAAGRIEASIEEVSNLTRTSGTEPQNGRVDLVAAVERETAEIRDAYPDAVVVTELPPSTSVRAVENVDLAIGHLLDNAVVHNGADHPEVRVRVTADHDVVRVRVSDDGPGLPAEQRAMLASGDLPEFDDPRAGFGLTMARMLVDESEGTLEATDDPSTGGTELTVTLPRANDATGGGYGVNPTKLRDVVAAALVAGALMGVLLQSMTGNIAIVGTLYGVANAGVGWATHQFHSVVFGVGFAAALSSRRLGRYRDDLPATTGLGVAYGGLLWLVAAGVVMPAWLRLVGVPAPIPSLNAANLLGHVVWGASLAACYVALTRWRKRN